MSKSLHFFILAIFLLCQARTRSTSPDPVVFPAPFTQRNRILSMLLAFNYDHIDPLVMIINEYLSMCEGGWSPTLILHTTVLWSDKLRRYLEAKAFCYRINSTFPILYDIHDPSINIGLGAVHRKFVARELYNHDLFIYQEDDIIVRHSHVAAYLYEMDQLYQLETYDALKHNIIGFQRYRRLLRGDGHHHLNWGEQDIFEQELLEETPSFSHICIKDRPYLRVDGNTHQAMWILTQYQVLMLQEKCSFLNYSNPSREHMSSIQIYDRRHGHCGMTKLLPPDGLSRFALYHYYQTKHPSWISVFDTDEGARTGGTDIPPCWNTLSEISAVYQHSPVATNVTLDTR